MKMFVFSDNNDTYVGLRLAGVDGVVVHTREELAPKLAELLAGDEYGVILVTEKLHREADDLISGAMAERTRPLFYEIPDRHGFAASSTAMSDFISQSIGLKL